MLSFLFLTASVLLPIFVPDCCVASLFFFSPPQDSLRTELRELGDDRNRLAAECDNLKTDLDALRIRTTTEIGSLRTRIDTLQAERDRLIEEGRQARRTHQEAVENLKNQLAAMTDERDRGLREIERLKEALATTTAKRDEYANKAEELQRQVSQLNETIQGVSTEIEEGTAAERTLLTLPV